MIAQRDGMNIFISSLPQGDGCVRIGGQPAEKRWAALNSGHTPIHEFWNGEF
jgi:hypothetical protein